MRNGSGSNALNVPIVVHAEARGLLRAGAVAGESVRVGPASAGLVGETAALAARHVAQFAGRAPAEIDALQPARELYRAFGIDPTRTRPSSEALLRRALRGQPLPSISNAVDLANMLALDFLLPIGLYDLARISGRVHIRRGAPGESYEGIRKGPVHVEGRPVMADDLGAFGNPTSDSLRTAVDGATRGLLVVIFAPRSLAEERLRVHVASAGAALGRHLGATVRTVPIDQ